jgi:fructose-1,6-bisphosphatase/inositol monophosphatase family enzyme
MSLELAYVAQGTIDLMLANRPHLWDIAPGGLLVEEAGGVVRGFDGEAVFPFTDEIAIAAEQRYRIVAGGVSAVESVLPHLRALPG